MEDFMLQILGGVIGVIAVSKEETNYRVSRGEYFGWFLASIAIIFGLAYLSVKILDDADMLALLQTGSQVKTCLTYEPLRR